jgi:hypothetical protein
MLRLVHSSEYSAPMHVKTHCKYGHEFAVVGYTKIGSCAQCKTEYNQKYRAEHLEQLKEYDRTRGWERPKAKRTACRKGHEYAVFGQNKFGKCRECDRLKQQIQWHRHTYFREIEKLFGVTADQYHAMFAAQDGKCAICRKPQSENFNAKGKPQRLAVDHNHATNEVRELLCYHCNLAIGHLDDSIARLFAAISYLQKHQRIEQVG